MGKFLAGAALAAAILGGGAGAANAVVTYDFTVDHCSGAGCGYTNYGYVDVTGQTTDTLTFDFHLASNVIFNEAGNRNNNHDAIWFNLNEGSTTVGGLANPFSANGLRSAGAFSPNGASFGAYDYLIHQKGGDGATRNGNPATAAGGISTLTFTVRGAAPALVGETVGANQLFFVIDIAAYGDGFATNPLTGRVGAVLRQAPPPPPPGVPEPATWAMMLLGFGGMGALLRRSRRIARMAVA